MRQQTLFDKGTQREYEEIQTTEQLKQAYKLVKGNKGAAGIDKVTVEEFGRNLEEEIEKLASELREWRYEPQAVRKVEIPKPGSQDKRTLGIPTVRDRIVQQSIKISIERYFEPEFSESSYGFRPGRGQAEAIGHAKELENKGKQWVVDIDLERFFDRINHDKVIHLMSQKVKDNRVLRLVGMIMRSGVGVGEEIEGAPQGSPLSPLLSNIVLDELDKELERRGLEFCRYADDCNIYVGSQKAGNRVMSSIRKFIEEKMKLKINITKSKVGRASMVKFLGVTIYEGMVVIAKKSLRMAMAKVKELTPRGTNWPLEKRIAQINQWYVGWSGYYKITEIPSQLKEIEAHIRRRIRAQLVGEQKRKRYLYQKLIKLGVTNKQAQQVYGSKGRWKLSHTRAVEKAWSNQWFIKAGFKVQSNLKLPHWQPIEYRIALT